MKKTIFLAIGTVLMAVQLWGQTPPEGTPYIELEILAGYSIRLDFMGNADNTPIWVETSPGNYESKVIGTDWCGYQYYYITETTEVKVYGNLKGLDCGYPSNINNKVTRVNIEHNQNLTILFCANNELTALDVSQNPNLEMLICNNNQLVYLNIASGNNTNITDFDAKINPDLTCIKVDEGFNPPSSWQKDATASWNNSSSECGPPSNSPYIELTEEANEELELSLTGHNDATPVWVETSPGNYEFKIISRAWSPYQAYNITGTKVKIYGNIKTFDCGNVYNPENKITSINIENNQNLKSLHCSHNKLKGLDVSQNANLDFLICKDNNQLVYLNVANGNNANFIRVIAYDNSLLRCIKVDEGFNPPTTGDNKWHKDDAASWNNSSSDCEPPSNTPYIELTVMANSDLKLDLRGNADGTPIWIETSPDNYQSKIISKSWCGYQTYSTSGTKVKVYGDIETIECGRKNSNDENQITSLNIAHNTNLINLYCPYNKLTALDVSQNPNLESLNCDNNKLVYLNVANGNNANFSEFYATNNPDLTCIKVDEGFNPPSGWEKDATASWSNSSSPCDLPDTPPAGMPYIELTQEANADLKLDLRGSSPGTPVWVETSSGNYESKVIETAWCGYETYSISGTEVKVYGNLNGFDCGYEGEESNTDNKVTKLNIEHNVYLIWLSCVYNKLVYLNVANGNNANFTNFYATNNPNLTCIKVDEGFNPPASWEKDDAASWNNSGEGCVPPSGTPYIELTVEENSDLKLDLRGNADNTPVWVETSPGNYESKVIGTDWCDYQTYSITGTEVKVYGNLKGFDCGVEVDNEENKVSSVNIEKNLNLTELYCVNNKLTALDVKLNANLKILRCKKNQLTYLNVANGNNANFTSFDARDNPNLTCIKVDEGFNPPSDWHKDDIAEWRNDGTDCETSISQLDDAGIQLYPNPASGQISISVPDSYIHNDMVIYNLLGQSLMRIPLNDANQSVDVSSLKSGVYVVKIGQNTSKLLIK